MKTMRLGIVATGACIVSAMMLWVGCEDATFDNTISVTPSSVSVTNVTFSYVMTFTGSLPASSTNSTRQLYFPLLWSLSNPALGSVRSSTGDSAVYVANQGQYGAQVITVRDQADSEGFATIAQTSQ